MSLRFHEIAEANHHILNPFTEEKLQLLGEICHLHEDMRLLDLACGKGEMLIQWAQRYNIMGVGVDISSAFIETAKARAFQLDVSHKLNFLVGDAADYPEAHHQFDIVSCIGATWIGGGLPGTLQLMQTALRSGGGILLVGEAYWREPPNEAIYTALETEPGAYVSLGETLERFEAAGLELVEMIMADTDSWDRYEARQWMAVRQFVENNPDDENIDALQNWIAKNRRAYLTYSRRYLGWGIFILREAGKPIAKPPLPHNPHRPVGVDRTDTMLWVRLEDGRVIGTPIEWYPWLKNATPEQFNNVELTANGLVWHDLNQRLEVADLLRGQYTPIGLDGEDSVSRKKR